MAEHEVTPRDIEVLRYVTRHGVCSPEQVMRAAPSGSPFFTSPWACYRRLRALQELGLLSRRRTWWRGPQVVMTTALGIQLAGVDLPPARFIVAEVGHALSVVDLSETLLAEHPGSQWLTERELRRDAMRQQRSEGLTELRPTRPRTPDGLLVLPDGRRVAIELDLTNKRSEAYTRLLSAYAGARGINGVWWFSPSAAMRSRFEGLIRDSDMTSFVEVHDWTPTIRGPGDPGLSLEA